MKLVIDVKQGKAPTDECGEIIGDVILICNDGTLAAIGEQNRQSGHCNCCGGDFHEHYAYAVIPGKLSCIEVIE